MSDQKKPSMLTETPKTPEWQGCELKSALPINFGWRANRYNALKLTKQEIEMLADDKAFGYIVRQPQATNPPAKS